MLIIRESVEFIPIIIDFSTNSKQPPTNTKTSQILP